MKVSRNPLPVDDPTMKGVRTITKGKGKRRRHAKKGSVESSSPELSNPREEAEMRLAMTVGRIQNNFVVPSRDKTSMVFLDESDPRSGAFIEDILLTDVWRPDGTATSTAWSAATTSAHIRSFLGAETNEDAAEMGFRPYAAHRSWMNDAFATKRNKKEGDTEYDAYTAERLLGHRAESLEVGDMLFRGYNDSRDKRDIKQTKDWSFGKFKRTGLESIDTGKRDAILYNSHTDTIVGTGVDAQGRKYYDVSGGNVNQEYMVERMYPDELRDLYAGSLRQNSSKKPAKD